MHVVKVNAITKSTSSTVTGLQKKWQTSNDMQIDKSMTTFIRINQSDFQAKMVCRDFGSLLPKYAVFSISRRG